MDILVFENQEEAERNLTFYVRYNALVSNEVTRLHNEAATKLTGRHLNSSFFERKEWYQFERRRSKITQEQKHYFISELEKFAIWQ